MNEENARHEAIATALKALEARAPDVLPLYTFFPSAADGSITVFEAFELADDEAARRRADRVLASHPTATEVTIWCDDRLVGRHPRAAA